MAEVLGEARACVSGKRDGKEGGCWSLGGGGEAEEWGKRKDSASGKRAPGRESLGTRV